MAYKHDDKSSGQLIRSADWNMMGHEIERLETDKVNRAGDTIKGDLTVTGKAQFGPLAVTGDASVSGKAQLGPLTVSGDASVSGKAQLGSLVVTGDANVGNLKVMGERIKSADGLGIVQTNAKDWLRINPDSHYPSIALYNPVAIGEGGLSIGDWSQMPKGQLKVTGQAQLGSVVISSLQLSGFTGADQDEWPNVVWYRDPGNNWDEGLIKHSSAKGKFGRAGFGVHFHQAREFGLWSTGWDPLFAVEGGSGNAYFKGNLRVTGSISCGGRIGIKSSQWGKYLGVSDDQRTVYAGLNFNIYEYFTLEMACSRDLKENIDELTAREALTTLAKLNPIKYDYKDEKSFRQNLGFIAEEMPDNLASSDRRSISPFEIIPILTRVVQEQQIIIVKLESIVKSVLQEIALLNRG